MRTTPEELQTAEAVRAVRTAARITDDVMDFQWSNGSSGLDKFVDDTLCRRYFELDRDTIARVAYDTLALIEDWKARVHEDEPDREYGIVRFSCDDSGRLMVPVAGGSVHVGSPVCSPVGGGYTFDRLTGKVVMWVEVMDLV